MVLIVDSWKGQPYAERTRTARKEKKACILLQQETRNRLFYSPIQQT